MKNPPEARPLVGLVVEGGTEYAALPPLLERLGCRCTTPSAFHGQPAQIPVTNLVKHTLLRHVRTQLSKGTNRVVVVLDREQRSQSAAALGSQVQAELRRAVTREDGRVRAEKVFVAIADARFENWLLADPEGVLRCALFSRRANVPGRVSCHADQRDALEILRTAMKRGWFNKAIHGPQVAAHIRVGRQGLRYCSPSFVHFLSLISGS